MVNIIATIIFPMPRSNPQDHSTLWSSRLRAPVFDVLGCTLLGASDSPRYGAAGTAISVTLKLTSDLFRRWVTSTPTISNKTVQFTASLIILAFLLAGCGGGSAVTSNEETKQAVKVFEESGFRRASAAWVQDWEGVWIPLDVNEPGYTGGRRVKNLYLYSDEPAKWIHSVPDTKSTTSVDGDGLLILHAEGQNGSPYLCNSLGDEPGPQMASLFASRAEVSVIAGPTFDTWYPVGRTNGTAIGSESNNPALKVDLATPRILSQTAQQFERHMGWCQTYTTKGTAARTYRVRRIQFEDLAGAKVPVSGEYCPSTDKPGICWHASTPSTRRGGYITDSFDVNGIVPGGGGGGILTEGTVSPIEVGGLLLEPSRTNQSLWSAFGYVGTTVLDGASTTHNGAPAPAGSTSIWTDPRSERLVYNKSDITLAQDGIVSQITDLSVFRAGFSIWIHVPSVGAVGPFVVAESSTRYLRVLGTLPNVSSERVSIHRVPALGDSIIIGMNGGTWHYSTVTGISLPSLAVGLLPPQLLHQSLQIDIANPLTSQGGSAGGNGNLPVYWYNKTGVTVAKGPGVMRLVRDESVIDAGLGYLLRQRLVLELRAGATYALFDLPGVAGQRGEITTASIWARTIFGRNATVSLQSHTGGIQSGPEWRRLSFSAVNLNGTGQVRVSVPAGGVVRVALPQVEVGALTGPIVTTAAPETRAAATNSALQSSTSALHAPR